MVKVLTCKLRSNVLNPSWKRKNQLLKTVFWLSDRHRSNMHTHVCTACMHDTRGTKSCLGFCKWHIVRRTALWKGHCVVTVKGMAHELFAFVFVVMEPSSLGTSDGTFFRGYISKSQCPKDLNIIESTSEGKRQMGWRVKQHEPHTFLHCELQAQIQSLLMLK